MSDEKQKPAAKRILIIGSTGHPRETNCYCWEDINRIPNIADYDVVIMDITALPYEMFLRIDNSVEPNLTKDKVDKLLDSNGHLFLITSSRLLSKDQRSVQVTTYHGLGNWPMLIEEEGETILDVDPKFRRYFDCIKSWTFTISFAQSVAVAKNRYGRPLGIKHETQNRGNFYILPKPTEISTKEGINILLEEFYGIRTTEQPEPDWAREIKVPGVDAINKSIADCGNEIKRLNEKIDALQVKERAITKFKKLLYTESYELEQIVRETLREFGAVVHDPSDPSEDDGRIITSYGKGVLEIKKKTKSADKGDVRQLDEWVGNCLSENEDYKGILIMNHYGDLAPESRGVPFPDNVKKYALNVRKQPFCLLTTLELFNAYCAFKENRLLSTDILQNIFAANGECRLLPEEK